MSLSVSRFASMIEHTKVKGTDNIYDIEKACKDAKSNGFGAVCVNPFYIEVVKGFLQDSKVELCTGIGFPLGASLFDNKMHELERAVSLGADAVDYVINVGALKAGNWDYIEKEISMLVNQSGDAITKLIIETCYLDNDEIVKVSKIAADLGVDYVKTSTGMGTAGAKVEDVELIRETINGKCKIKASGGIRTLEQSLALIKAGASRLGTSSGIYLVDQYRASIL